jgi:hypothetical protein
MIYVYLLPFHSSSGLLVTTLKPEGKLNVCMADTLLLYVYKKKSMYFFKT